MFQSSDGLPSPDYSNQRLPTLHSCLKLFLAAAPAYYVRWHFEDWEVERFITRLQQGAPHLLEQGAVVWNYAERAEDDPYQLHEYAVAALYPVDTRGCVEQDPLKEFAVYPLFNLERFRRFVRSQPHEVRFSISPGAQVYPLCQYVRECFDTHIILTTTGTGYLLDEPDADEVLVLPFWAQLFVRIFGAIAYDNLAAETLDWQQTVLNILEIVELLVAQYGELRNLIPV